MANQTVIISLFVLTGALLAVSGTANLPVKRVSLALDDFHTRLLAKVIQEQNGHEEDNIVLSPLSLSTVLSMLMAGSAGSTYSEIYKAIGFDGESDQEIFPAYRQIFNQMNAKLASTKTTLEIANSIAMQNNSQLLQSFLGNITEYFEAELLSEDFRRDAHEATANLNRWVSSKTRGKIEKLFDSDLDPATTMLLMNAVYFKGNWKTKFDKSKTMKKKFMLSSGQYRDTTVMTMRSNFNYANFEDGRMLEMPYENQSLSMYIFLPNEAIKGVSIGKYLTTMRLDERIAGLSNHSVMVELPKFHIEGSYTFRQTLSEMGIPDIFTEGADLSKINGERDLHVNEIVQKTHLEVNEEGAEAAAATGAIIRVNSVQSCIYSFYATRPFLFFIRDKQHKLTIFSGVINNPNREE